MSACRSPTSAPASAAPMRPPASSGRGPSNSCNACWKRPMNLPDADEPFSVLLAAYDEALAAGVPADAAAGPPELQARLHRARSCLERLERDRRHAAPKIDPGKIGRFVVRREIGRGGYGIVFLAFDPL